MRTTRRMSREEFSFGAALLGPQGEFLFKAPDDKECEAVVEIDLSRSENVRRWWPFLRDRRIDAYGGLTSRFLD